MPEEPKKMALLRILQILQEKTDCDHILTQQQIIDILSERYGITLDRKAVAKNISCLKEADYDIVTTRKGAYLASRKFDNYELHFLIDSITGNSFIRSNYTDELKEKIAGMGNEFFESHSEKIKLGNEQVQGENSEIFLNIENIYKAINDGVKIKFDYNYYKKDMHLHKVSEHTVSPYKLIINNRGYYLLAYDDHVKPDGPLSFLRVDHMTNVRPLEEKALSIYRIPGLDRNHLEEYLMAARPYMFSDKPERIEMIVIDYDNMISQLVDWFGTDLTITDAGDDYGSLRVTLMASPMAMKHWAMQYMDQVQITDPPELRAAIIQDLQDALGKYELS